MLRFATASLLNYGFAVALVWLMPPREFAAVGALQNLLLLSALVMNAGFPWALSRANAGSLAPEESAAVYRAAIVGNVSLGALLSASLIAARAAGLEMIPGATAWTVVIAALMLPSLGVTTVFTGGLHGLRRFGAQGALQIIEIFVKCVLGLTLVGALGMGPVGVALGFLGGSLVTIVYGVWALHDRYPGMGPLAFRHTFSMTAPMWVATACFGVLSTADILGLATFQWGVGIAAVAVYQVAAILARILFYVADAVIDGIFPFMVADGPTRAADERFLGAHRALSIVILPCQVALFVAAAPISSLLFPSSYAGVADVVRVLDVGTLGLILTAWYNKALCAQGLGRLAAKTMPFGVALEVGLLPVLTPRWGLLGAASAFTVGTFSSATLLVLVYRKHRPPAPERPLHLPRHVLALAAPVPVLVAACHTTETLALLLLAVALALGAVAARMVGIWDTDDLRRVLDALRSGTGRTSAVGPPPNAIEGQ